MTEREERAFDAVDELVKGYMVRKNQGTDATRLLTRIRASRQACEGLGQTDRVDRSDWMLMTRMWTGCAKCLSSTLTWAVLTLLACWAAFMGGRHVGPPSVGAAVTLRNVGSEHARGIDRCYRVQYSPDPSYWDGKNKLEGPSSSLLWTRGDQFWSDCTISDTHLKVGRDSDGVLWISPSPLKGIRFTNESTQLPQVVSLLCAVNSMIVPRLMEEVLANFNSHLESSFSNEDQTERTVIWARLKPGRAHPLLSAALLEIDPDTKVLNRLVLWMVRGGQPQGIVTYTLVDSSTWSDSSIKSDDRYRLESHLESGAEIVQGTLTMPGETLANPAS